jgi:hypothetical protein
VRIVLLCLAFRAPRQTPNVFQFELSIHNWAEARCAHKVFTSLCQINQMP